MKDNRDFYTSDGRIDPDKAFGFVLERMESMTDEEFIRFRDTPVLLRGAGPGPEVVSAPPSSECNQTDSVKTRARAESLPNKPKLKATGTGKAAALNGTKKSRKKAGP